MVRKINIKKTEAKLEFNNWRTQFEIMESKITHCSSVPPQDRLKCIDFDTTITSFLNPFSFNIMLRNQALFDAVDYWYSDGFLLCEFLSFGKSYKVPRYSFDFSSVASEIFQRASNNELCVCLIGGADHEIGEAAAYINAKFPGIQITRVNSGYFEQGEEDELISKLNDGEFGLIVIGMGTPLQEQLAVRIRDAIPNGKTIFTCGGFLSQTALGGDYYPRFIKVSNLRWLYRAIRHKYVRKRLLVDYPQFIWMATRFRLRDLFIFQIK